MPGDKIEYRSHDETVKEFIRRRQGKEAEIAQQQADECERTGASWRIGHGSDGRQVVEVRCRVCGDYFMDGQIQPWEVMYCVHVPTPECNICRASAILRLGVARQEAEQRRQAEEQQDAKEKPAEVLAKAGVPSRWQNANLEGCTDLPPKSLSDVQEWAAKRAGTLTLLGIPGSGKTYLAAALLRWMLETGLFAVGNVRFIREHDLLDLVRSLDWYKPMKADPRKILLLVYDDLGSARMDDKARSAIAGLIEKRHADELATILTTNLSMSEIGTHLDPRVASRLSEDGSKRIELPKMDLRARKK